MSLKEYTLGIPNLKVRQGLWQVSLLGGALNDLGDDKPDAG